ncbi:MAG: peptidase M15 [Proteobacteria bacterium]|nr:peptidase M15 [Pseudomonadota bacterium]
MRLSKNLTLSEVTKSNTAIKKNIPNQPTKQHLQNLTVLAQKVFQPIRDYFDKPIYISSGYRSKELNKYIGGASRSQHSKGEAIDIDNDFRNSVTNKEIFDYIKDNLDFDQLINEQNYSWIHVSYKSSGNRNKVLDMVNGKYTIHGSI